MVSLSWQNIDNLGKPVVNHHKLSKFRNNKLKKATEYLGFNTPAIERYTQKGKIGFKFDEGGKFYG